MTRLHVIVTTHTPRHLRRTLLGVACQSRRADSVTVTVDGDGAARGPDGSGPTLREVAAAAAIEMAMPIRLVTRKHQGVCRSAQVRNNGARTLVANDDDLLVFFDGDCCPEHNALEAYADLASSGCEVMIGHWLPLTEQETASFDEAALRAGRPPAPVTPERESRLSRRVGRYRRHLLLRRLGLLQLIGQGHKPKLASGNFAIRLGLFRAINGFDELYEGYGQEDDDLGRRAYKAAGSASRIGIAVDSAMVFHQWHPTRAPTDWHAQPGVARFKAGYRVRCERGLERPVDQPDPMVELLPAPGAKGPT